MSGTPDSSREEQETEGRQIDHATLWQRRKARFIFPVWVFVVSVYILVLNYRRTHEPHAEVEPLVDD